MAKDEPNTGNGQPGKHKRVNVYLAEDDYNKLRSALILKNKSVSEWVRIIIKDFLDKYEQKQQQQYEESKSTTNEGGAY
jgi:metal-responsive CopG/Arc/MetJ family transcriptional regulator